MNKLPFGKEEFDIIWSEGAVYNIGFRNGVNCWKEYLKHGGILAVSELSWTTVSRPKELEDFWNGELARRYNVTIPPQWIAINTEGEVMFQSKVTNGALDSAIYFEDLTDRLD